MSNYNQVGQGRLDQKQQGNSLGAGQNPPAKPGHQADLPDRSNEKDHVSNKQGEADAPSVEQGLIHQPPGLEGG